MVCIALYMCMYAYLEDSFLCPEEVSGGAETRGARGTNGEHVPWSCLLGHSGVSHDCRLLGPQIGDWTEPGNFRVGVKDTENQIGFLAVEKL